MTEPGPEGRTLGTTRRLPIVEPGAPAAYETGPPPAEAEPPAGRARRFWSARRIPSTITALICLAATGAVLYDVAAVRAGRPAMHWRRGLAHELASRPLQDRWVLTGAAVAVVLGIWLIVLALTPGLRPVLTMRTTTRAVRAGLDRDAAAIILRDRLLEISGVRAARVVVTRRRITARIDSHFRELDEVRADVDTVLADAVGGLGLHRRLPLQSHVLHRAGKG